MLRALKNHGTIPVQFIDGALTVAVCRQTFVPRPLALCPPRAVARSQASREARPPERVAGVLIEILHDTNPRCRPPSACSDRNRRSVAKHPWDISDTQGWQLTAACYADSWSYGHGQSCLARDGWRASATDWQLVESPPGRNNAQESSLKRA